MTAGRSRKREVRVLTNTPTVSASPNYTAGDNMGGLISLEKVFGTDSDGGGRIDGIMLADAASNGLQIDVWFFDANPTGSTFTDNSAQNVVAADFPKVIDVIPVVNWDRQGEIGVARIAECGMPFVLTGDDTLYVALEARGAHNLAATTDIDVQIALTVEKFGGGVA